MPPNGFSANTHLSLKDILVDKQPVPDNVFFCEFKIFKRLISLGRVLTLSWLAQTLMSALLVLLCLTFMSVGQYLDL